MPINKVENMSPREIRIHNTAQLWINTYEDEGAKAAILFYNRRVLHSVDHDLIVDRMAELNGH
ncbi:hypothetical protein NVP1293O_30 [Vibrio phage 1.293.O._10N.261.52.E1]|nr:hypothetical protein NVP1293O_30 [Vibrio phage 1.293.O._10N.261.52.E1]